MLKDFIKNRKESVYKVSKESGIPYTTLNELVLGKKNINECTLGTIMKLMGYFKISVDDLINICNSEETSISNSWNDKRNKKYIFKNVTNSNLDFIVNIHPINQNKVLEIYKSIIKEKCIKKAIIFGSSTNVRCNKNSDIDIFIELDGNYSTIEKNRISLLIEEANKYNANVDLLWADKIDKNTQIYRNIMNGVNII